MLEKRMRAEVRHKTPVCNVHAQIQEKVKERMTASERSKELLKKTKNKRVRPHHEKFGEGARPSEVQIKKTTQHWRT